MVSSWSEATARLRTPEGQKLLRYSAASLVSLVTSLVFFVLFDGVLRMGAVWSSTLATAIATIPNYHLNRKWAWGKSGKSHMMREIVPFWVLAVIGWAFSTYSVKLAESSLDHDSMAHIEKTAKGFMPDDEGAALYRAATEAGLRSRGPLLEVGTYCGKSAVYLGAAARRAGTVAFSVDHHHGSEENQAGWEHHDVELVDPRTGRMDTLPWARRTIDDAGLGDVVVLVVGASITVASGWSTPLGLLFIDGGHAAEVAWADYRAWTPLVAPGGTLAIHDVFADPAAGGRPPYELYRDALASGAWAEEASAGCGSLRVLHRT